MNRINEFIQLIPFRVRKRTWLLVATGIVEFHRHAEIECSNAIEPGSPSLVAEVWKFCCCSDHLLAGPLLKAARGRSAWSSFRMRLWQVECCKANARYESWSFTFDNADAHFLGLLVECQCAVSRCAVRGESVCVQ